MAEPGADPKRLLWVAMQLPDRPPAVIDCGTGFLKCGLAGEVCFCGAWWLLVLLRPVIPTTCR